MTATDLMADWPEVTIAEVHADQQFFYAHPTRRYYTRPSADGRVWVVRRRGRRKPAFLRSLFPHRLELCPQPFRWPDNDDALREAWFEAAYPDEFETPAGRAELVKLAKMVEPPIVRR